MDNQQYFLSIDNGTQSVRAMVFDAQGQLIAKSKIDIEPYFSDQPGWAEQHAEYFWDALCKACQALWPLLPIPKESIAAVSVTTQRATAIAMGADNQPLRPAISWLDQRQVETKPALGALESALFTLVRAKPLVDLMHKQAEANWIAQNEPNIWDKVHKFVLLSGYHNYKLTGEYKDAVASTVGFLPFDYKTQQWADKKDWKWRAMPITQEMLPEVLPAGAELGRITLQAATETGIPKGLPLIASGSDKACEVLGTGCIDSQTGSLSYGSLATLNIASDKYIEAIPFYPAYPGVIPKTFSDQEILDRYIAAMVYEGTKILQEKIAIRPSDIDVVFTNGYGFPKWRGGPMKYADMIGLDKILLNIQKFSDTKNSKRKYLTVVTSYFFKI